MNEYLYRDLIVDWIPYIDRPILQKKDVWLLAYQRVYKNRIYRLLLSDINIHGGRCDRRFCICRYFTEDDKLECFDRIFRTLQ
jgi:hypothetical protein